MKGTLDDVLLLKDCIKEKCLYFSYFRHIKEVYLNIHDFTSAAGRCAAPVGLDNFREAASVHEQVILKHDGQEWTVHGIGSMPGSQRQVAWVQQQDSQTDTTSAFVEALQQTYSSGIAKAIASALDLQQAPGKPLAARTITAALDMASTSKNVLKGVNFLTELHFSAANAGAGFTKICHELGLDHTQFDSDRKQHIDLSMAERFSDAQQSGNAPVSSHQAAQWLRTILESQ